MWSRRRSFSFPPGGGRVGWGGMNSITTPIRAEMRKLRCVGFDKFSGCDVRYVPHLDHATIFKSSLTPIFSILGLLKHPAKTFIGRIDKGFDVLGYHIRPEGPTVARTTVERFVARARRLYERERGRREAAARLGGYVQR